MPQVDKLISSIRSLYLVIGSFGVLYVYIGVGLYQHNQAISNLSTLDRLLALRDLTSENNSAPRSAARIDLVNFYRRAAQKWHKEKPANGRIESKSEPGAPWTFTLEPMPGVSIKTIPMRLAREASCEAIVVRLLPRKTFRFTTLAGESNLYRVQSDNTDLISFSPSCEKDYFRQLHILRFRLDGGGVAFGIPDTLDRRFAALTSLSIEFPSNITVPPRTLYLSFPKIISARSDDAAPKERA